MPFAPVLPGAILINQLIAKLCHTSFAILWRLSLYGPCIYSDVVSITGWISVDPIGLLEFSVYEQTDTALSDHILVTSAGISQIDQSLYRRYLSGPVSAMNFVELIKKGGGVFNGTFEAFHASAFDCDPNLSNNYPPLSISGTIDTSTRRVNLRITGKVFL